MPALPVLLLLAAIGRIIDRHRTLARADGFLAQRIAEL